MSARLCIAPFARLQRDKVRGVDVLLVPESVLELNAQGAEVVLLCDGTRTEEEIVRAVEARYADPKVGDDVRAFIARLTTRGLIERG